MLQIPKHTKVNVIKLLLIRPMLLQLRNDGESLVDFLDKVFDLKSLPSDFHGYTNAYVQAVQALVRNDDWEYDYIFLERFPLTEEGNDYFEKFISNLLDIEYRRDQFEIQNYVQQINSELEVAGFKVVKLRQDEEHTLYEIQPSEEVSNLPTGIVRNRIEFQLVREPGGKSNSFYGHKAPTTFPCLVLVFNPGWNDYDIKSEFNLFYYQDKQKHSIGELKIMTFNEEKILSRLGDTFTMLSDEFCSAGQSPQYYKKLKATFGSNFESILFALKDVAFFPKIYEKFERKSTFINSLLRYDSVERNARTIKMEMNGRSVADLYRFSYDFQPNFASEPIKLEFDFDNDEQMPNRIFAFIGKNGTGKTQLMNALPMDISNEKTQVFQPLVPSFGKVIAVSYSAFDTYPIPKTTASFNYVYCGLRDEQNELMTDEKLAERFKNTLKNISLRERTVQWRNILKNFIPADILEKLFRINEEGGRNDKWLFDLEVFLNLKNILSSGQKIIFYIISEIVSHIRLDSLILYDEPETHLHPNAITELMNAIYDLVEEFESYCILATHSPLIIRELMSKNVFVVEKEDNIPSVRRIALESFGENLTVLTDEVFGNKDVPKQYKTIVKNLIRDGNSYEQILDLLEFDDQPLSLNVRLFIKSQINN